MISDQMFSHYVNRAKQKIRQLILDSCQLLAGRVDKEISIFCNNCIGAFVASDFRLPFNSPTVNLMIPPADYVNYISNLEHYINADIEAIDTSLPYPVALLEIKCVCTLSITIRWKRPRKSGEEEKTVSTGNGCSLFLWKLTVVP